MIPYPVNLHLRGRSVLLVGGGRVACRKLVELHRSEAEITLVSPELHGDTAALIEAWGVRCEHRAFRPADTAGCFLAIAAANEVVNREVASAARRSGALVNVVDDAALSDFSLPATARRGRLLLTASTSGALPALSRRLREQLERSYGEEYAAYLDFAAALRPVVLENVPDPVRRRELFLRLADSDLVALHANAPLSFRRLLERLLPPEVTAELDPLFFAPEQGSAAWRGGQP